MHQRKSNSRESSLKSFNSGGTSMMRPPNNKPASDGVASNDASSLKSSGIMRDDKRQLVNPNSLISRFHNYVNQH